MYKNRKIIALIPARGGSKGIKLKNLKKIKNKTLIGHVADFVNKSKIFDISIVSTDNNKIKKEAIKNKLKIIHRPRKLAGNKISDIQVITHSLKNLPKYNYQKFYENELILLFFSENHVHLQPIRLGGARMRDNNYRPSFVRPTKKCFILLFCQNLYILCNVNFSSILTNFRLSFVFSAQNLGCISSSARRIRK